MRRLLLAFLVFIGGCRGAALPIPVSEWGPDLSDLGRPWPVEVGEFNVPVTILAHDDRGMTFASGRPEQRYHRLDYDRRHLAALPSAHAAIGLDNPWGSAEIAVSGGKALLRLVWPNGSTREIAAIPQVDGDGVFAQSSDLTGLAFYEETKTGCGLSYYDQATGIRQTWRTMGSVPDPRRLSWSASGRYLLEETAGRFTIYDRGAGRSLRTAEGTQPLFDPTESYLLFLRTDGRHGILEIQTGFNWPLPASDPGYRPLPAAAWSPDGSRVFILAEAETKESLPFRLYVHNVRTGETRRYPLPAPIDLGRYSLLLQTPQPDLDRLVELLPQLEAKPLAALGAAGYLIARGNELCFLDLRGRMRTVHEFDAGILDLSLSGRNLVVLTEAGRRARLHVWRLPSEEPPPGPFPDGRDLSLGALRLGADQAEVIKALGRPYAEEKRIDPFSGRKELVVYRYPQAAVEFDGRELVRIIYSAPGAATGRGLEVGMSEDEVFAQYGRPGYREDGYVSYQGEVDGMAIKTAFTLDPAGKVTAILLARVER